MCVVLYWLLWWWVCKSYWLCNWQLWEGAKHPFLPYVTENFGFIGGGGGGVNSPSLQRSRVCHLPKEYLEYPPAQHLLEVKGTLPRSADSWTQTEMKEFCKLSWKIKIDVDRLVFWISNLVSSWVGILYAPISSDLLDPALSLYLN